MFKANANSQANFFSPSQNWTKYQKKAIEKGWAQYYRDNVFPIINEEAFEVLYSNEYSRPNEPINILISLLIFKEYQGMTDEEIIDMLMFDTRLQYALHIEDPYNIPGCRNMLNLFRRRVNEYKIATGVNLLDEELHRINEEIVKLQKYNFKIKRVDSFMISDSCKSLNRIELVYETIKYFLKSLEKKEIKAKGKYKDYKDDSKKAEILYQTKSTEENKKLDKLLEDAIGLSKLYKHKKEINETKEYKILERIINEQYDDEKKTAKENEEIAPTSLQTPYDEESTYRYKYGNNKGYTANVVESIGEEGENRQVLITDWEVAQNVVSDKQFMKKIIETKEDEEKETIVADSAYYSTELEKEGKEANIELIPTDMVGQKVKDDNLSKFEIDEETKEVKKCPNGECPLKSSYNEKADRITAIFDVDKCNKCPLKEYCAIKLGKKAELKKSIKQYNRAKQKEKMGTEGYKKLSKQRAGIEGVPSVARRKYNIDNRGGKGKVRLEIKTGAMMICINLKRILKNNQKLENIPAI